MCKVFYKELKISSKQRRDIVNITSYVKKVIYESNIQNGIVLIFLPHATAALFANEDEPNIKKDYMNLLERLVPESGEYFHNIIDNNADSHLLSALFKPFFVFPLRDGKLVKGTWQELFLLELDGPRERKVIVTIIGE